MTSVSTLAPARHRSESDLVTERFDTRHGRTLRIALRTTGGLTQRAGAVLGTHLSVILALTVGLAGIAAGLTLPPGGTALAWFVPLVDGAMVL